MRMEVSVVVRSCTTLLDDSNRKFPVIGDKRDVENNLRNGTVIENSASIYFDYNSPVLTNTAQSVIDWSVGVEIISSSPLLEAFPNPTTDQLTIQTGETCEFEIFSAMGQLVQSSRFNSSSSMINTGGFAPGIYLLSIKNHPEIKPLKIIKQ